MLAAPAVLGATGLAVMEPAFRRTPLKVWLYAPIANTPGTAAVVPLRNWPTIRRLPALMALVRPMASVPCRMSVTPV